jgi:DNA-directed RNA polymerase specialized sigma24 family protein
VDAEAEGFAQFVEARQRALQRTAWLLTGDWAVAEDLVQTALVRSWPRWERIRRQR